MSLPPHSLSAEYGILGSLLFEPAIFWRIEDLLTEADFFDPLHADVFAKCRDMIREGRAVDPVTVASAMQDNEALKVIGGEGWLTDLLGYSMPAFEAAEHAGIIAQASQKRRLMAAARDLLAGAEGDPDAALDAHEAALQGIRERQASHTAVESCADGDIFAEREGESLIPSGFGSLDDEIRGFERGALSIIAATWLLMPTGISSTAGCWRLKTRNISSAKPWPSWAMPLKSISAWPNWSRRCTARRASARDASSVSARVLPPAPARPPVIRPSDTRVRSKP